MSTPEYQKSVRLWANWELIHHGGREYELLQLCGKIWFTHQRFRAADNNAAIEKTSELMDLAEKRSPLLTT